MKHLRVKLVGELDKLFLAHLERLRLKAIARFHVIEVMLFHGSERQTTFMRYC